LKILIHTPGRLAVSVGGIMLAVVLMLSQDGFRNALFDSQTHLIRRLNGELFIVGQLKYLIYVPEPFASRRIHQARGVQGVQSVRPLYVENVRSVWKNPHNGSRRAVRVLAFDPDEPVFDFPELPDHAEVLKDPDKVLFDRNSRDFFGRPETSSRAELAGRRVEVVGTFALGTDFLADGSVIMSDRNFLRFFPGRGSDASRLDTVEIGIIRLEPGADPRTVQRRLRDVLQDDVVVLTRQELLDRELDYWHNNTAIGYVFTLGMVVGFVIGTMICYQILYTNVSNYLPQFATLKAMGFTRRFLVGVVLQQGVFLALLGFVPAVGVVGVLFWAVARATGLLLDMTPLQVVFILALTVAMCLLSGGMAVRRVLIADPAEVFR
jgi:putative ABC transport system permease protein